MIVHPAFTTVFARQAPKVTLIATAEDLTALTTYTFTPIQIPPTTGTASIVGDDTRNHQHNRVASKSYILMIIHAEDALTAFSVTSAAINNINGDEISDRGGGVSAINTAIYRWSTDQLKAATGDRCSVTFSEAVTGCAISILLVENVGLMVTSGSAASNTGTGAITGTPAPAVTATDRNMLQIAASTLIAAGETAQFSIDFTSGMTRPILLYDKSNANFSYAAAWMYGPAFMGTESQSVTVNWSGAGAGDLLTNLFM